MADCANKQSLQASLFSLSLSLCLLFFLPFHFDPLFFPFFPFLPLTGLSVLSFTTSPPVAIPLTISSPLSSSRHLPDGFTFLLVTRYFFVCVCVSVFLSLQCSLCHWHSPIIHKAYLMLGLNFPFFFFFPLFFLIRTFCTVAMVISNSGGGQRVGGLLALCKKELTQLPTFCIACYVRELVVEFFNISSCFCPLGLLFVTCRSSTALPLPPPSPPPAFCPSVAEPPCRT